MPTAYLLVAELVWGAILVLEWLMKSQRLPSSFPMFSSPPIFAEDVTSWLIGGLLGGWIVWRWLGVYKRWPKGF